MNKDFFINNRKKLAEKIEDNSVVVLFAGKAPYKSADYKYDFTTNRNFYYMTGINEDGITLVVSKIKGKITEYLFIKRHDPIMAKWVGATISEEEAKDVSGIENIRLLETLDSFIGGQIDGNNTEIIYFDLERREFKMEASEALRFSKSILEIYPYVRVKNIHNDIARMRMIKESEEVKEIEQAIAITKEGIELMMKNSKPDVMEYEIEAYFNYCLTKNGVRDRAFPTIAAAGVNATILHYDKNNSKANDGDLILFDLGAQSGFYNADITRTFPVNGKFTERQKQIYSIVLDAMKAVEKATKPGITFKELNEVCKGVLIAGCKEIGLIQEDSEISKYYYHGVGHHLGLDTHDVGDGSVPLCPGMVLTNEPGLYIEEENIGIRIEDDLLVTEEGCINLSKDIIKEIKDIEEFMKK